MTLIKLGPGLGRKSSRNRSWVWLIACGGREKNGVSGLSAGRLNRLRRGRGRCGCTVTCTVVSGRGGKSPRTRRKSRATFVRIRSLHVHARRLCRNNTSYAIDTPREVTIQTLAATAKTPCPLQRREIRIIIPPSRIIIPTARARLNATPAAENRCGNCRLVIAMISGDTCRWPPPSTGPNLLGIRPNCFTTVCLRVYDLIITPYYYYSYYQS